MTVAMSAKRSGNVHLLRYAVQMGELRDIRWSWESQGSDLRVGYLSMDGRISLADMITRMQEIAPGVALDDIQVNWGTATWTRPANAEELEERRVQREKSDQRHQEWELRTLAKLIEKYGAPSVKHDSLCPGTPHRGHVLAADPCPLDSAPNPPAVRRG